MYRVRENTKIMMEWQRRYSNLPLIFDGVVSPSIYWSEPIKVVICLKECVMYSEGNPLMGTAKVIRGERTFKSPEDSSYITDYLYETGGLDNSPTWVNECRIAELLLDGTTNYDYREKDGRIHRRRIFRRIAHVELSKLGGTAIQSDWYDEVINSNKDLIGRQLSNFDANYYVVCGQPSWNVVKEVINLEKYKHLEVEVPNNGGTMEFFVNPELNKNLILMNHPSDVYRFEKQFNVLKIFVKA